MMCALVVLSIVAVRGGAVAAPADGARDAGADAAPDDVYDPALISRTVRSQQGAIQECYERALKDRPSLTGRLDMRWIITAAGDVTGLKVESDKLADQSVADCLMALIASWKFPPPTEGSIEVGFPFVFQTEGPAGAPPSTARPRAPEPALTVLAFDNAELVATLTGVDQLHDRQKPHLELVFRGAGRASQAIQLDLTRAQYPELAKHLEPAFLWKLEASVIEPGPRRVARVSLWARRGDDLAIAQEIAILVAVDGDPKVLWVGLGGHAENQFGACIVDTAATFRLSQPGKMERRLRSTKSIGPASPDDRYSALRKRCKAPRPRTDLFPFVGWPPPR